LPLALNPACGSACLLLPSPRILPAPDLAAACRADDLTQTFTLAVAFLAACVAVSPGAPPPKVLFIGVDGTRPDALALVHTPNLDALKTHGGFSDRAVTHPVTHSAAFWSSLVTGVWGDKPGVNDPGSSVAGNRFDL